jgi:Ras-related protein Rab-2A
VIILVGNKVDLVEGGGVARQVTEEEAREFAERHGLVGYIETSAKTGKNVDEVSVRVRCLTKC